MTSDKDLIVNAKIEEIKDVTVSANIQPKRSISASVDVSSAGGGTKDHNKLVNRNIANQHPVSAITGLEDELTELQQDITSLSSTVQSNYTTLNTNKVDKEDNKSLILNSEIERLATLHNYDDTSLNQAVNNLSNNKVDKVSGKSLISDSEITRLANLTNYDDTQIKQDITSLQTNKADKSQIPTIPQNISAFNNDVGYLTEHQSLSNYYNKSEVDAKVSSVYRVCGSVASYYNLPNNAVKGDVYNVLDTGSNYVWTGIEWDKLSETVDLTPYLTKQEASTTYQHIGNYALKSEIPTVPTNISAFNNDSGYIDNTYHDNTKQDTLTAGTGIDITNNVISSTVNSVSWGNITGNITNQRDLQISLSSKANLSDIPTIPPNLGSFVNDVGYITSSYHDDTKQDVISNLSTIESNASSGKGASDTISTYGDIVTHNASDFLTEHQDISGKQDLLISGTNIKTVNNQSLLGSGNINIQSGGGTWGSITGDITSQYDLQNALNAKQDKLTAGDNITIARQGGEEKTITTSDFPISFIANGENLLEYKIIGNLSQAGTPTPSTPVDVNGVGEIIEITNGTSTTNVQLTSPLYKIGGSIDYLNYASNKVYRNCKKVNLSTLTWTASVSGGKYRFSATLSDYVPNVTAGRATNIYFNRFAYSTLDNYGVGFGHANKNVYIYVDSTIQTVAQLQSWLGANNSYIVYPISSTIEEDITLPNIPTNNGANSLDITGLKPSEMVIKYSQGGGDLTISADVVVPTKTSELTNDSGFITNSYHDSTKQDVISDLATIRSGASLGATAIQSVKTINNESIVGSGNVTLSTYHPPILSCMWSDHLINDIQWLRADTFSWQSGDVYTTAYNKLVEEYATGTEETEGSITFKRTSNGFKIALATQESAILNKYNTDGIAWYYILDTANKRFKLPRTKFGFEGLRTNVGDDIDESLPNIKGKFGNYDVFAGCTVVDGVFEKDTTAGNGNYTGSSSNTRQHMQVTFNASRSSSTYQDNATVQERATQMYLYFYVGEYAQSAIEQTAGLNTDLFNNKLDLNASNLNTQGREYVSGLGFPSSISVNLTLGASGSRYTAPANGYVFIDKTANADWQQVSINTFNPYKSLRSFGKNSMGIRLYANVKKGEEFSVEYSAGGATSGFIFIYAEGSNN